MHLCSRCQKASRSTTLKIRWWLRTSLKSCNYQKKHPNSLTKLRINSRLTNSSFYTSADYNKPKVNNGKIPGISNKKGKRKTETAKAQRQRAAQAGTQSQLAGRK